MANPIVTSLPAYVDESREQLIAKATLGAKSATLFNIMSGVKGKTDLHLLSTDVVFQDGSTCGFNPEGTQEISRRTVEPKIMKVNMTYCPKNLLNTYASHMVQIKAGIKDLPYEEAFTNDILAHVNEKMESLMWNGDSSDGVSFDGILTIAGKDSSVQTLTRGASVYEDVKAVYLAAKEEIVSKDDFVICLGLGDFRALVQELVAANLYHYEATDSTGEIRLFGTNTRIIGLNGLNGTNAIVGVRLSNLYYAVDLTDGQEKFAMWYSQDDDLIKLAIEWLAGVQYAYGDEIVIAKK